MRYNIPGYFIPVTTLWTLPKDVNPMLNVEIVYWNICTNISQICQTPFLHLLAPHPLCVKFSVSLLSLRSRISPETDQKERRKRGKRDRKERKDWDRAKIQPFSWVFGVGWGDSSSFPPSGDCGRGNGSRGGYSAWAGFLLPVNGRGVK